MVTKLLTYFLILNLLISSYFAISFGCRHKARSVFSYCMSTTLEVARDIKDKKYSIDDMRADFGEPEFVVTQSQIADAMPAFREKMQQAILQADAEGAFEDYSREIQSYSTIYSYSFIDPNGMVSRFLFFADGADVATFQLHMEGR